ncbi:MAG TPA: hypothetical protein VF142_00700 [Longimicrobium sp.]
MRFGVAAAALAALTLAVPAAAQENAVEVLRGVLEQLAENTEGVDDYTLALRAGELRSSVYVFRDGDEWEVASPDDEEMSELLQTVVVWPMFGDMAGQFPDPEEVTEEDMEELEGVFSLASETLEGRRTHALYLNLREFVDEGDEDLPDSMRIFVDPQTRQILRMHVAGMVADMGEFAPGGGGGDVEVTMDFRDYRETEGLTVPRRLRMDMRMDLGLTDEQKLMMQAGIQAARVEMEADDSEEGRQAAAFIDMFISLLTEGRMAVDVEVEDVQVNTGPPAWYDN